MSDIQIGELYLIKKYFWFLFPTKELAEAAEARGEASHRWVANIAKLLSENYKCNISVIEENTYFVLLEQDNDYIKILDSNGNIAWIVCWDFSRYFELVKAKQ